MPSFCRKTSMSIKFLVSGGGGEFGFFGGGGGEVPILFYGCGDFLIEGGATFRTLQRWRDHLSNLSAPHPSSLQDRPRWCTSQISCIAIDLPCFRIMAAMPPQSVSIATQKFGHYVHQLSKSVFALYFPFAALASCAKQQDIESDNAVLSLALHDGHCNRRDAVHSIPNAARTHSQFRWSILDVQCEPPLYF